MGQMAQAQWNILFALLTRLLRAAKTLIKCHLVDLRSSITHLAWSVGSFFYFSLARGVAQPYMKLNFEMAQHLMKLDTYAWRRRSEFIYAPS